MPYSAILPTIQTEIGNSPPDAAVIWLHGLGADGHDFEAIIPQLGLHNHAIRFIFPHAPAMAVTVNGGYIMPAWYDILSKEIDAEIDHAGINRAASAVQLLIERELMRGINPKRVIIAGFSQGAVVALHFGLHHPTSIGGIIALSGYLPFSPPNASSNAPAIFLGHGINDSIVPFALGDNSQRQLHAAGYKVTWHSWPMEHSVCAEESMMIGRWITQQLDTQQLDRSHNNLITQHPDRQQGEQP